MLLCLVKGSSSWCLVGATALVMLLGVGKQILGGDSPVACGAPVLEGPARGEQPERCRRELGDDGAELGHGATCSRISMSLTPTAASSAVWFMGCPLVKGAGGGGGTEQG